MKQRIPDNSPLLRRYPELALFGNREDREAAWDIATEGMTSQCVFLVLAWIVIAVICSFVLDVKILPKGWITANELVPGVVWGAPCGLSLPIVLWFRRRHIERSLREQLIQKGHAICMKCGYDLTGNSSGVCPECGTAIPNRTSRESKGGAE